MPRWITRCVALSKPMIRFLPRRCTDLMVWPSTSARKSLAVLWRRTTRPLVTAADLIFLPMRSRASDARTVSTSGSSGISSLPRRAGGLRLGTLLRSTRALHAKCRPDLHGRVERRLVRGALRGDLVDRRAETRRLGPLAQSGLGVDVVGALRRGVDVVTQHVVHERLGGFVAALEVERRHDGFEGVGEQ